MKDQDQGSVIGRNKQGKDSPTVSRALSKRCGLDVRTLMHLAFRGLPGVILCLELMAVSPGTSRAQSPASMRTPSVYDSADKRSSISSTRRLPVVEPSFDDESLSVGEAESFSLASQAMQPSSATRLPPIEDPRTPLPHPLEIAHGVRTPLLKYQQHIPLELQHAIHLTLLHAPELRILEADVGIASAEIDRQQAAFDWTAFLNSAWDDRNAPVGSALDGAQNRLLNTGLNNTAGVRQQNRLGGSVNIGQDANFADSNSQFFTPRDQATAQLGLTYEQPLLQGGGRLVATSRYEIAIANAEATREDLVSGLQSHILETINAYWELVSSRARYAIQKRNYQRAVETFNLVENRGNLDVGPAQAARSEATLAARKTELLRNEYAVVLAQENLLRLIYGPRFNDRTNTEWIPATDLLSEVAPAEPVVQQQLAVQFRPEVRRTLQEIKQASIEQGVAKNLLLPVLGMTMSMSNQGLQGNRQIFPALADQLTLNNASYGFGIAYEMPIGNRAAKANLMQAKLRIARLQSQFETVLADISLEVRNAAHNLTLAIQELEMSTNEMLLAKRELEIIETRYQLLIDGDNVGALYLDNLLQTQERLAGAELRFATAATRCKQAEFELQRANGLLLRESDLGTPQH